MPSKNWDPVKLPFWKFGRRLNPPPPHPNQQKGGRGGGRGRCTPWSLTNFLSIFFKLPEIIFRGFLTSDIRKYFGYEQYAIQSNFFLGRHVNNNVANFLLTVGTLHHKIILMYQLLTLMHDYFIMIHESWSFD